MGKPTISGKIKHWKTPVYLLTVAGWSYGLSGNLAKAPRFDAVEDFDKSEYSLFKIHTHIDARGFLWVNFDSAQEPSISWDEQFEGVDLQPRLKNFDMENYVYDHTWSMDGDFNWKTLVENYNEVRLENRTLFESAV